MGTIEQGTDEQGTDDLNRPCSSVPCSLFNIPKGAKGKEFDGSR
jgi:hypothetical protein